jgi:transcription elongation factor GreA
MHENDLMITATKKAELEQELHHLKTVVRPAISDRLQAARALGDLSENAEYQTSRDEQGKNEGRIQQIEHILKYGKVITRTSSDRAELGATVTLHKEGDADAKAYMIVSETEADIAQNKISPSSLIGAAMMGKMVGDSFTLTTPRGEVNYKIVEVS